MKKETNNPPTPYTLLPLFFGMWKRPWCWKRLRVGEKGGDRGWQGWMASMIQRTWVCASWEIVKDKETWRTAVHGVAKSWTRLTDWTTTSTFIVLCDFLKMHVFGSGFLAIFLNTLLHVYITWLAWPKSYLPKVASVTMLEKYFWKRQCPYQ